MKFGYLDLRTTDSFQTFESVDLSQTDRDGNNPLHIAIQNNLPEIVTHLYKKAPACQFTKMINQKNEDGKTPLDLARENHSSEAIIEKLTPIRAPELNISSLISPTSLVCLASICLGATFHLLTSKIEQDSTRGL